MRISLNSLKHGLLASASNHIFSCSTMTRNGLSGHCDTQLQGTTDQKLYLLFLFHKHSMGTASSRS